MMPRWLFSVALTALLAIACVNSAEVRETGSRLEGQQRLPNIDHVAPPRDSVGPPPGRFEWTAAEGADHYTLALWTEVGSLLWRADRIRATSFALPQEVELEFGTYFWTVTAFRDDRPLVDSGRSAFVVKETSP
jgi:hypothetical protein